MLPVLPVPLPNECSGDLHNQLRMCKCCCKVSASAAVAKPRLCSLQAGACCRIGFACKPRVRCCEAGKLQTSSERASGGENDGMELCQACASITVAARVAADMHIFHN